MADFLMPDISHYQPQLTTARARQVKSRAGAIMLKATDGTGFVDPNFKANAAACRAANLLFGAYHYVQQGAGAAQADHFWSTVRDSGAQFVCIDWEKGDRATAKALADRLRQVADVPVGGYYGAWARQFGGPLAGLDWAMVPHYGPAQLEKEYYPHPYPLAAWQYTDGPINGTNMPSNIPGIGPCDVSVVYRPGDLGLGTGVDDMTKDEQAALKAATDALKGVDDYLAGTAPADTAPAERKRMYRALAKAGADGPAGGSGAHPHTHEIAAATTETGA